MRNGTVLLTPKVWGLPYFWTPGKTAKIKAENSAISKYVFMPQRYTYLVPKEIPHIPNNHMINERRLPHENIPMETADGFS